ncbi:hypothetical protein [Helicobacter bilis]|uniref:hypothetical protein n=1 Tax=Helicobacter bilis TaxID=37372 RepID=UPI0020C3E940|nr:hypothetical protein [Helicobacter bilis]
MIYIFLLMSISTILSYLILKFIYRIIFKSKKKISKFLVFLGSIILIIFYYTPYSFYVEPSYWQFRRICKLNELPNDEYKYNKILGYFDTDLDNLDWEGLKEVAIDLSNSIDGKYADYLPSIRVYRSNVLANKTRKYWYDVTLYFNNNGVSKEHITYIKTFASFFKTNRYFLEPKGSTAYSWEWNERSFTCRDLGIQPIFLEQSNEKQRND